MVENWYSWEGNALILRVRVSPRCSRNAIAGTLGDHLKICLTAPPVDGKANRDLVRFLARQCGVPQNQVDLISGATARTKRIRIDQPRRLPEGVKRSSL
jgi:uncharacterized protein